MIDQVRPEYTGCTKALGTNRLCSHFGYVIIYIGFLSLTLFTIISPWREKHMMKKRRILLKAVEHNWGLIGPGDWSKVTWRIFFDGFYEIVSTFIPTLETTDLSQHMERRGRPTSIKKKDTGTMGQEPLSRLQVAIKRDPWRDSSINIWACDGTAWEIESYHEDGSIEKSSGKIDYIYGNEALETIVDLLPRDGNIYGNAADIHDNRKDR